MSIPGPVYGRPSARQEARVEATGRGESRASAFNSRGNRESRIACDETRRDANGERVRNTPGAQEGSRNMSGIHRTGGYALLVSEVDSS